MPCAREKYLIHLNNFGNKPYSWYEHKKATKKKRVQFPDNFKGCGLDNLYNKKGMQ